MQFKTSQIINATALTASVVLLGLAIAGTYLASDGGAIMRHYFPPGFYRWNMNPDMRVRLAYNRSSEIKTLVSSGISIFTAVVGIVGFWFINRTVIGIRAPVIISIIATLACIVSTVCIIWASTAEVSIKRSTCWFDGGAIANKTYTCSTENVACNFIRFTGPGEYYNEASNTACLELRYARFMIAGFAAVEFVIVVLYAAFMWMGKRKETEFETASRRFGALEQDE